MSYLFNTGVFSELISRHYFRQLISGLEYMLSKGFTHRDLKLDNLLLDDKFRLKIADFGYAGPLAGRTGNGYLHTILGTFPYMAPEIHEQLPYKGE